MKTKLLWVLFIVAAIVFSGCDPTDVNTDFKNYWSSNSLVRLKLRGKVKSVQTGDRRIDFNEKGFMTSDSYTSDNYSNSTVYNYASDGKLMSKITTNVSNSVSSTNTTTFTYDTHGKYVINSTFHLHETGLTPNLRSMIGDNWRTDYVFQGNDLLVINTYDTEKDTLIVKYDGKYPVSSSTSWSFMKDMEFASNGMFSKYSEGFMGQGYRTTRIHTFEKDDEYLLLKSVREENLNDEDLTISVRTLSYNDTKDILTEIEDNYQQEYFDYLYDEKNNWTSRKYRYNNGPESEWTDPIVETRIITYWN
ncbi:MAG: hypothetical protein JXR27_01035 [Paludibacteraceae bacterium]|nr:hypothetical protein [Paludibacteraceae bacterium]